MSAKRQVAVSWSRVWEIVNEQRQSIPMSWADVAAAGGPSETTMRKMRKGEPLVEETTRTALCRAIGWEVGSISEILAGRPPILRPQAVPGTDAEVIEALGEEIALLRGEIAEIRGRVEQIELGPQRAPRGG